MRIGLSTACQIQTDGLNTLGIYLLQTMKNFIKIPVYLFNFDTFFCLLSVYCKYFCS